uniref:Uncharacterized protein n=1 Tax=Anopheles coluzzii TaxID=1518534 RepID=A0A8W7NZA3_ANOCL
MSQAFWNGGSSADSPALTGKQFCFRQPGQATQLFAKPNDPRPRLGCIQSCVTPYVWAKVHSLLGGEYGQIREPAAAYAEPLPQAANWTYSFEDVGTPTDDPSESVQAQLGTPKVYALLPKKVTAPRMVCSIGKTMTMMMMMMMMLHPRLD